MRADAVALILCAWSAGLGCAGDTADSADTAVVEVSDAVSEVWQNHVLCPPEHPALLPAGTPIGCSPGLECRWPAAACEAGAKPDNVCKCEARGWRCESHVRSCLPIVEDLRTMTPEARPAPPHRPTEESCSDPSAEPRDGICSARYPQGAGTCDTSAECATDEVCLDTHVFGGRSACACGGVECRVDADCGTGELCHCGTTEAGTRCDGWSKLTCGHRCDPADCRVDADCGPGGYCSPSYDVCGYYIERWTCHDPIRDECLSDAECPFTSGGRNLCRATASGTWTCTEVPLCE